MKKKNSYMDELRRLAGYDEFGNEIDENGNVVDDKPASEISGYDDRDMDKDVPDKIRILSDAEEDDVSEDTAVPNERDSHLKTHSEKGSNISSYGESGSHMPVGTNEDSQVDAEPADAEPPYDTTGSIECKILLKAKDMRHFMFRHNYTSISGWFGILISIIALVMVILGFNVYGVIQKVVLILLALLFTVIQPLQIVLRSKQQIKRQDMFQDTLTYNLCKEGILVRQADQHVNVPWDTISKVVYTSKAIFVYTSPVRAFIFPLDQLGDAVKVKNIIGERTSA